MYIFALDGERNTAQAALARWTNPNHPDSPVSWHHSGSWELLSCPRAMQVLLLSWELF